MIMTVRHTCSTQMIYKQHNKHNNIITYNILYHTNEHERTYDCNERQTYDKQHIVCYHAT
jgi:hypothetical protein